jgi:hypothetical protein
MRIGIAALTGLILFGGAARGGDQVMHDPQLEVISPTETGQIEKIVRSTIDQLKKRYPGEDVTRRNVHPKDHGCVTAKFRVSDTLPEELRVGVFAKPGREYQAWIRFSNADPIIQADSPKGVHGSRGMAIKLLGVSGTPLIEKVGPKTQDFLMINQPVFAFSNVEDYEVLSRVLAEDGKADRFFAERIKRDKDTKPVMTDPATLRALRTAGIVGRIRSLAVDCDKGAFQPPPASPVENQYFSAAPYLFGPGKAMKFSAWPDAPPSGNAPDVADPDYMRTALDKLLTAKDAKGNDPEDIVFTFGVQVRTKATLAGKLETEIEDACVLWKEEFVPVATITIPPQNINDPERKKWCEERLIFTPWHGLVEHQPLGGINRLKLAVYEASSAFRHIPKEPAEEKLK